MFSLEDFFHIHRFDKMIISVFGDRRGLRTQRQDWRCASKDKKRTSGCAAIRALTLAIGKIGEVGLELRGFGGKVGDRAVPGEGVYAVDEVDWDRIALGRRLLGPASALLL